MDPQSNDTDLLCAPNLDEILRNTPRLRDIPLQAFSSRNFYLSRVSRSFIVRSIQPSAVIGSARFPNRIDHILEQNAFEADMLAQQISLANEVFTPLMAAFQFSLDRIKNQGESAMIVFAYNIHSGKKGPVARTVVEDTSPYISRSTVTFLREHAIMALSDPLYAASLFNSASDPAQSRILSILYHCVDAQFARSERGGLAIIMDHEPVGESTHHIPVRSYQPSAGDGPQGNYL